MILETSFLLVTSVDLQENTITKKEKTHICIKILHNIFNIRLDIRENILKFYFMINLLVAFLLFLSINSTK